MTHRRAWCGIAAACAVLLACGDRSEDGTDNSIEQLERRFEVRRHDALLARIATSGAALSAFTTDGCSGGLSVGWEYLAGRVAPMRVQHGTRPAWEACCVAHDRRYHAGPGGAQTAQASFDARRNADLALKACVLETGRMRAPQLAGEYGLSIEAVDTLYAAIADLMYRAVRAGGMPCTGLPWRWGYGWPECE
jgi:hypothetical protein